MRNTLIVQFREPRESSDARVLDIADTIAEGFEQNHAGYVSDIHLNGIANILIIPTGPWDHCIEIVLAYLKLREALHEVLVIKRRKSGSYKVVWPHGFTGDFVRIG